MLSKKHKICCFIGHRTINRSPALLKRINELIINLISQGTRTFLFGSNSEFDALCYECVSELKEINGDIERVYVKAEYFNADERYTDFLKRFFENTLCLPNLKNAGKAVYVKRNFYMIDISDCCVFYYDKTYMPSSCTFKKNPIVRHPKSGTKIAYEYAEKKSKNIINLFEK